MAEALFPRHTDGVTVREQIWGEHAAAIERALAQADPDLARYVMEFAYEEAPARPGLDLKSRELQARWAVRPRLPPISKERSTSAPASGRCAKPLFTPPCTSVFPALSQR